MQLNTLPLRADDEFSAHPLPRQNPLSRSAGEKDEILRRRGVFLERNDMKKSKYEIAKEALKTIAENQNPMSTLRSTQEYAAEVLKELTAPRMETVEVKRWEKVDAKGKALHLSLTPIILDAHEKTQGIQIVELTGTYLRPVEEKEPEVWEREVKSMHPMKVSIVYLPDELVGHTVEVRLKDKEEE